MVRVPILRKGRPYSSLDRLTLTDFATCEPVAEVSLANSGLISRDLSRPPDSTLQDLTVSDILDALRKAAEHFMESDLPAGDSAQSPGEFVRCQSATTGMPYALCRANMNKIHAMLFRMDEVLSGLTGGLDLSVIDAGFGLRNGHTVSYAPCAKRFGAVLPANSPGVHSLWIPAIALKTPVALKPGTREPWTPLRILEALKQAGLPESAFGFYPSGHDGANVILRRCERSMLFGAGPTVAPWKNDPGVEIHGPGNSKIILGPDSAESWADFVDLIVSSAADNGGRSCINASQIWTTSHADELAQCLAARLAEITPMSREDPQASLAAFSDPRIASAIEAEIARGLASGGAEDVTARFRGPERKVGREGATYMLPTVIRCDSIDHPLASKEYLFPFVSVVEMSPEDMLSALGPTLVLTAISDDAKLRSALMARDDIGRLNFGPISTTTIKWDQPHEGNLFEHLYRQRAFQQEPLASVHAV
jgi:hypothetical protein